MRAVVIDGSAPAGLRVREVAAPEPAADEVLVRVVAYSMNPGELHTDHPDGTVLGWEAAGHVVASAVDGSGPPVGTPVLTLGMTGGWAELRAVSTAGRMDRGILAPVGPDVDLGAASTALVAGGSALRALHRIGPILGRRVLVTGATGGVGRFAVQLAHRGGAHVTALTRDPAAHAAELRTLGADDVVAEPGAPVHGVVDTVGGSVAAAAFAHLAPHGVLVTVGHSAGDPLTFPHGSLLGGVAPRDASLVTFFLAEQPDLAPDLAWLADQVHSGRLDPGIAHRGDDPLAVAAAVRAGRLGGKAVVDRS